MVPIGTDSQFRQFPLQLSTQRILPSGETSINFSGIELVKT